MVDVYSDWCGPCAAMQANLKKIKLEVGGDMLQLAMVRLWCSFYLLRLIFFVSGQIRWYYGAETVQKQKRTNLVVSFGKNNHQIWKLVKLQVVYISQKGKMVNLMFGADAPKLGRLILEELKKEQAQKDGQATNRVPLEVTELAEEEQVRHDAAESIEKAAK